MGYVIPRVSLSALALTLAILSPAAAPAAGSRQIIFIDDFIRDAALRTDDWGVNGPAAAKALTNLDGDPPAALAAPVMRFGSDRGLTLAGSPAPGQQSAIQTNYAYTPPFRVTATVTPAQVGPKVLEFALATADGGAGVGVLGGAGEGGRPSGFAIAAPAGPGQSWRAPSGQAQISSDSLAAGRPYAIIIDIDASGLAHVYVQSEGRIVGAADDQVGLGPFYVVLGQASGADAAGQPNLAYWKGVTITGPQ